MVLYYLRIGLNDTLRAKRPLLANLVVVAGICLPVLLLLGLRRGLVAQFRDDLLKSPTACQLTVQADRVERNFNRAREAELQGAPVNASLVIPAAKSVVLLSNPAGPAGEEATTLVCTKPGDPLLAFYGADVLTAGDRGIVISTGVAKKLGVAFEPAGERKNVLKAPAALTLSLQRADDAQRTYAVPVPVRALIQDDGSTAYLERQMMVWLDEFKQGLPVRELNLPGLDRPPTPRYDGYLAFTKRPLDDDDRRRLYNQGLTTTDLNDAAHPADPRRSLYGLLSDRVPGEQPLNVYWLYASLNRGGSTVDLPAREVESIAKDNDLVVFPWAEPQVLPIDGRPRLVVGVSARARWLRGWFRNPSTRLDDADGLMNVVFPRPAADAGPASDRVGPTTAPPAGADPAAAEPAAATVRMDLPGGGAALLQGRTIDVAGLAPPGEAPSAAGPAAPATAPLAVVPAALAAHLARVREGAVDFDALSNRFLPHKVENEFPGARVYARDIQFVPDLDRALRGLGYLVSGNITRVKEMLNYSRTLDMMAMVVFASVIVFGILTILFVFSDLAYRKRGAIGIMRIMGTPRGGVLLFFGVRSMVIGLGGALVALPFGYGLAWLLKQQWHVGFAFDLRDVAAVLVGGLLTTVVGGAWPSVKTAYRLDPVDAIANSRVQ